MNIEQIHVDKQKIIENILDRGYVDFENEITQDDNYSLADDEIAEMYYELLVMEIKRILPDYEFKRITK